MIKVGVIGAGGRMGRMLIQAVAQNPETKLAAAIERKGSSLVGVDAGELVNIDKADVALVDDLSQVVNDIDVLIDFSLPESTVNNIKLCAEHGVQRRSLLGLRPCHPDLRRQGQCDRIPFQPAQARCRPDRKDQAALCSVLRRGKAPRQPQGWHAARL